MPKESYKYKFKISVIILTYQSFSSLCRSLISILHQDFPTKDYEIIAISHGVKDGALVKYYPLDLVQNLKTDFVERDPIIKYQYSTVVNKAINLCEGKLVYFMHDNTDLIGTDYLSKLWIASNKGESAVLTPNIVYRYNTDGTIKEKLHIVNQFYSQQDAVPLKYLKEVGGFDTEFDGDNGYVDLDMWKRLEKVGCPFNSIPEGSSLMSIKHNIRDLYPQHIVPAENGQKNQAIYGRKWM